MRNAFLLAVAAIGFTATGAQAQDTATSSNGTSFRGIRIEANAGGDRFQSQGNHNDKFGYGGTIGFDGQIGERIVIGAEGSYWRANEWNENCSGVTGGTVCHKSFDEYGAAVRAGVLATPQLLIFAKGGYVVNEQRKRLDTATGGYYDHFNTSGYQVGGGVEYSLTGEQTRLPLYANVQYVYSQYNDHTARQRVMAGVGLRFK